MAKFYSRRDGLSIGRYNHITLPALIEKMTGISVPVRNITWVDTTFAQFFDETHKE